MLAIMILCRVGIGSLLILASIAKLTSLRWFYVAIRSMGIMSDPAAAATTVVMPVVEVAVAAMLFIGGSLLTAASLAATTLFLLFAAVIASVVGRGVENADCGCFGGTGKPSWALVGRNLALASVSLIPAYPSLFPALTVVAVTALGAAVMLAKRAPHGDAIHAGLQS
jgi:hypothetical protein